MSCCLLLYTPFSSLRSKNWWVLPNWDAFHLLMLQVEENYISWKGINFPCSTYSTHSGLIVDMWCLSPCLIHLDKMRSEACFKIPPVRCTQLIVFGSSLSACRMDPVTAICVWPSEGLRSGTMLSSSVDVVCSLQGPHHEGSSRLVSETPEIN